jgi:hypothetical protein
MRQTGGSYVGGLHVISAIMAVSVILPLLVRPPAPEVVETRIEAKAALR